MTPFIVTPVQKSLTRVQTCDTSEILYGYRRSSEVFGIMPKITRRLPNIAEEYPRSPEYSTRNT